MQTQIDVTKEMMEQLRARKERIKNSIAFLQQEVIDIDIELRNLRQSLPELKREQEPEKPTRIKKTDEEIIAELEKQLAETTKEIEHKKRMIA